VWRQYVSEGDCILEREEREEREVSRERGEKGAGHVAPWKPVLVASLYGINTFDAFEGA
jgi:hypothetical protein